MAWVVRGGQLAAALDKMGRGAACYRSVHALTKATSMSMGVNMAVARLFVVNVAIVSVAVLERDVAVGVSVGGAESVSAPMVASPNDNPRARVKRGRGYEVPRVGQVWRAGRRGGGAT